MQLVATRIDYLITDLYWTRLVWNGLNMALSQRERKFSGSALIPGQKAE